MHEIAWQKTVDLASGSRPPPSSNEAEAALVPDLDGPDERQDSVDKDTPKISELNRVSIWGSANQGNALTAKGLRKFL